MLSIWLVRRHVIKPRVGVVHFGAARKTRLTKFNVVMLTLNVIAFGLGISAFIWHSFLTSHFSEVPFFRVFFGSEATLGLGRFTSALFGLICLALFSVAAYFLDFHRLYVYGLLVGLSPLVGEWLWRHGSASHHGLPITFGVSAGIMIVTGLFVFIRLLNHNPIPIESAPSKEA